MAFLGLRESTGETAAIDPRLLKDIETHPILRPEDPNAMRILEYISAREGQTLTIRGIAEALELDYQYVYVYVMRVLMDVTKKAPAFFSFELQEELIASRTCKYTRQSPIPDHDTLINAISDSEKIDRKNLCIAFLVLHKSLGQALTLNQILQQMPYKVKKDSMRAALTALGKALTDKSDFIPFQFETQKGYPSLYTLYPTEEDCPEDIRELLPYLILQDEAVMRIHSYLIENENSDLDLEATIDLFDMDAKTFHNKTASLARIYRKAPTVCSHILSGDASRGQKTITFRFKIDHPTNCADRITTIHRSPSKTSIFAETQRCIRTCSNIGEVPFDNTPREQHQYLLNNSTWALYRERFQTAVADCLREDAYAERSVHTQALALKIAAHCKITKEQAMLAMDAVDDKMQRIALELGFVIIRNGTYWTMCFLDPEKRKQELASRYSLWLEREFWDTYFFDPATSFSGSATYKKVRKLEELGELDEGEAMALRFTASKQQRGTAPSGTEIATGCNFGKGRVGRIRKRLFDKRFETGVYLRGRNYGYEVVNVKTDFTSREVSLWGSRQFHGHTALC